MKQEHVAKNLPADMLREGLALKKFYQRGEGVRCTCSTGLPGAALTIHL